jgi:hypothetical protein
VGIKCFSALSPFCSASAFLSFIKKIEAFQKSSKFTFSKYYRKQLLFLHSKFVRSYGKVIKVTLSWCLGDRFDFCQGDILKNFHISSA